MHVLHQLWNDEAGFIVSTELLLVAMILVISMIIGLTTIRDQVVQELGDLAAAISDLNQSFSFGGATAHHASVAGSSFTDLFDDCDGVAGDAAEAEPQCIEICDIAATPEI